MYRREEINWAHGYYVKIPLMRNEQMGIMDTVLRPENATKYKRTASMRSRLLEIIVIVAELPTLK